MPIPGTGVVPVSGSVFNELAATTRRAFVPKLIVQIYFGSPTLFYMMGNAQRAAGGLSQVTVPMQGASMVQGQFTGYGGGFNSPQIIPAVQNGQWNLAYWVVPIPIPFGESIIQSTDTVLPVLKARMNDAFPVTRQNMARLMFTNNSASPLYPDSFQSAFDNGSSFPTYGGISRTAAGNSAFQGQYINATSFNTAYGANSPASIGFTRTTMSSLLGRVTDAAGGEAPTFVVMAPGDFQRLNEDFIGIEQIHTVPPFSGSMDTNIRSSFPNLNVSGIPIFADHFIPTGNVFGVNCKYTAMYISEDANFDFSGFYSLVPINQIGQQGLVILGYDVVSVKSSSGFWCYGVAGARF